MISSRFVSLRLTFVCVMLAAGAFTAAGQMTVINTPSTDTLQAKMFYIEVDFTAKLKSYRNGGFQTYGYRTVYGIDRKTEAGVSLFYTRTGTTKPIEAQFSLKRKLFAHERFGLASTAGVTAYVPLNKAAGSRTFAVGYGNFSKTIQRMKNLRLTAGAYRIFNGGRQFGTKTGVTLAFEQPVFRRVSVIGDWSSGKNRFGYSAVGASFALNKKQAITASYNFSNAGNGDNFLYVFYSYTL